MWGSRGRSREGSPRGDSAPLVAHLLSRRAFLWRLFATFVAVLVLLEVGLYLSQSADARALVIADGGERHLERSAVIVDAYQSAPAGADPWDEVRRNLGEIHARPGVVRALVVTPDGGLVVAASTPALEGAVHLGARVGDAVGGGSFVFATDTYLGREVHEYMSAIELAGDQFVFEVEVDPLLLNDELAAFRRSYLGALALTILLAIPLLYALGGRGLAGRFGAAKDQAALDGLTGLHNRWSFREALDLEVSRAQRFDVGFTLGLWDIDDFKSVNDSHGHRAGDEMLIHLAQALRGGRAVDRSYRVGGDEFAMIMPDTGRSAAVRAAEQYRRDAVRRMAGATASVGLVVFDPADPTASTIDAGTLRDRADKALYEAKRRGGDQIVAFTEVAASALAPTSPETIRAVRRVLADRRMGAQFQPIWNLRTRRILGVEGLARPPRGPGLTGPLDAFSGATDLGRVDELDTLCRTAVLADVGDLPAGLLVFLNLAPGVFMHDGETGQRIQHEVESAGLRPDQVVIELPDGAVRRLDLALALVTELRDVGFRLALDHVGAGVGGLGLLGTVRPDFIKVDRATVLGASRGGAARPIWAALVAFAAESGEIVIAVGIETREMLDFVNDTGPGDDRGFIGGQGYLLGRPSDEPPWRAERRVTWPVVDLTPAPPGGALR